MEGTFTQKEINKMGEEFYLQQFSKVGKIRYRWNWDSYVLGCITGITGASIIMALIIILR